MIFKTTIKSEIDNTQKFIYTNDNNQIVEIAYIDKDDGKHMMGELDSQGIECEFYDPPGRDVGASCGQFLFDYYKKYSKVANG
jgi:adenine C2-methylase RlmN of 23S rRNA A2503 and tRNA A37